MTVQTADDVQRVIAGVAERSTAAVRAAHAASSWLDRAVAGVTAAVARLRACDSAEAILSRAADELAAAGVFDRVVVSEVRGSMWRPRLMRTGEGGATTLAGAHEIVLSSPLVEAEVVRRRLPALVADAANEPRARHHFMQWWRTPEYVVAPVVASSTVVALLHADVNPGGRALSTLDRDLLRIYADGVGLACERATLHERMEAQRRHVGDACAAALRQMHAEPVPSLGGLSGVCAPAAPGAAARRVDEPRTFNRLARLTGREREVLALMASGATNAQLADRLTVAESTVKSHVKHILHKLGVGNRAAAISCYLKESRAEGGRRR